MIFTGKWMRHNLEIKGHTVFNTDPAQYSFQKEEDNSDIIIKGLTA